MGTYELLLLAVGVVAVGYTLALLLVACVAVLHPDAVRRSDARKVLRLLLEVLRRPIGVSLRKDRRPASIDSQSSDTPTPSG
jgi:hypothetical protein